MKTQRQRRKFSSEFKAKVALSAIKEQETLASLSSRFGIHSNQILKWKKEFMANIAAPFDRQNEFKELEKQRDTLFQKVGELELDKDFLKKKLHQLEI